jgi:hypothetical protein
VYSFYETLLSPYLDLLLDKSNDLIKVFKDLLNLEGGLQATKIQREYINNLTRKSSITDIDNELGPYAPLS